MSSLSSSAQAELRALMLQLFRQLGAPSVSAGEQALMSNLSPGALSGAVFSVPRAPASGVAEPVICLRIQIIFLNFRVPLF